MRIVSINDKPLPSAATIGFFDGVHCGHRHVLGLLQREARERGLRSMVITFGRHPRQVLEKDYIPQLLSPGERKRELMSLTGVDCMVEMDFTPELARMTAREFMTLLKNRLGVELLIVGYDNRFGRNREESFADYVRHGEQLGMEVVCTDALTMPGTKVSSSAIRLLLGEGNVTMAAGCLGYRYAVSGTVIRGDGRGRTLGFPTANLATQPEQMLPARGVYAVKVEIEGFEEPFGGMMNIGRRPTFNLREVTLEVNILDFDADIYGRCMRVEFIERIREERKFSSAEQLIVQLKEDREKAMKIWMTQA